MGLRGATYRLQFHSDFTLIHATALVPYLKKLGIGTVYASPVFKAVPGSRHGYDTLDPTTINPELGTLEQYRALSAALHQAGMCLMQDIVPNHMAYDPRNPWLNDLLTFGEASPFATVFDIFYSAQPGSGNQKVMVPFLGSPLEEALEKKELSLVIENGRLGVQYYAAVWPLAAASYPAVMEKFRAINSESDPGITVSGTGEASYQEQQSMLRQFSSRLLASPELEARLSKALEVLSADFKEMNEIAQEQVYRLCSWKETYEKINFRRFFTVNALICLNMQSQFTFDHFHTLVKELIEEKAVDALRIDHVDGLYDPEGYLTALGTLSHTRVPLYVEKILQKNETLPVRWPVSGTTGYDFLARVNNLFTYPGSKIDFDGFALENQGSPGDEKTLVRESKARFLTGNMQGELENLCTLFKEAIGPGLPGALSRDEIREALTEVLIRLPCYRYYSNTLPPQGDELKSLQQLFDEAVKANPRLNSALAQLKKTWFESSGSSALKFYKRFMQFTGPLMAKGIEDTLMYTYTRFLAHNEVGDSPFSFGISRGDFHDYIMSRFSAHPLEMNATATHDTKRGEDARARLNVLSEIPEAWGAKVRGWKEINAPLRSQHFPGEDFEYFIYQTLAGTYPFHESGDYVLRLKAYLQKAIREGNMYSSWPSPDLDVEGAVDTFIQSLFDPSHTFKADFLGFIKTINDPGIVNSLSQLTLKCLLPGVPDVYQGCELWDFSFVDPDNRRGVDYEERQKLLAHFYQPNAGSGTARAMLNALWQERHTGAIKLFLMRSLLQLRGSRPGLFDKGAYMPLEVTGKYKDHVFAFMRKHKGECLVVVLPLFTLNHTLKQDRHSQPSLWEDTAICLPGGTIGNYCDVLTGEKRSLAQHVTMDYLSESFPVSVLISVPEKHARSAGILMHITSLPAAFGIGDLGPEAYRFARFLSKGRQKIWQFLPTGPTGAGQSWSPYSSFSSFAGNTLLISPEILAREGLLNQNELEYRKLPDRSQVNFSKAKETKDHLLELAYKRFLKKPESERRTFTDFCNTQKNWLNDFALYVVLKSRFKSLPWYEWPGEFKLREPAALEESTKASASTLDQIKWRQFVFFRQWDDLREYSAKLGIAFFGDLPFYCAYDSCDVWANRDLFLLDETGALQAQAGVPPDYFNAEGQLWGMPVYNWNNLHTSRFSWWIDRIRATLRCYDTIRLDHFRAFYDYWEVPSGESTARLGTWKIAPGLALFEELSKVYPQFPFIAEDLGDINENVYVLRDRLKLAGMKVLQFAFGDDMAVSAHIPHNYTSNFVVYTGTHDNNTSAGWFKHDLSQEEKNRVSAYCGGKPARPHTVSPMLIRLAYASVAKTAIIQMQDLLNLGQAARMNMPASTKGNWGWKLDNRRYEALGSKLAGYASTYNRSKTGLDL